VALAALIPAGAAGQGTFHPRWEIPGLDFDAGGVWRVRARAVREWRRQLIERRDVLGLNAPLVAAPTGAAPAAAVTGTIRVPALLFTYQGVDSTLFMRPPADYAAALFAAVPPAGRPYTLRSYYAELSNGLLAVAGDAIGWARLDSVEASYNGGTSATCQASNPTGTPNCNGIFSAAAFSEMQAGLRQALAKADPAVDFGQYDNDGPDGMPNTLDDDGYVDVIAFLHATRDGACTSTPNNHLWAHRAAVSYTTGDPSALGGFVRVRDYILQSALGGATGCDSTQLLAIGTMAHEFGHGLGLPDLYDTSFESEGIGQWGLMGSGNWTSPPSPSRMEAWSLNELGWIAVRPLDAGGTYTVGPAPTADTTLLIAVQGANPRGEYFLVENRQAVLADSAMIRLHCERSGSPAGCGGGLLVWHIDAAKQAQGGAINAGPIHGVALEQADGLGQLDRSRTAGGNRGDAGDPYPGVTRNPAFALATNPAAVRNADGGFAGFAIDSIRQVAPGGAMALRLRFGGATVVRATDTAAVVIVGLDTVHVFRDLLADGAAVTIAVPDTQAAADGRTRWRFASWSDGLPRVHDITGTAAGDTVIATLARDFRVEVLVGANGSVMATPAIALGGALVAEGTPVALAATAASGAAFGGWTGDTTASADTLTLPMGRPYRVTAQFDPLLQIVSAAVRPPAVMGGPYGDTLRAAGGTAGRGWQVVSGTLPPGLALEDTTGRIVGIPTELGTYAFTARVTSGLQQVTADFQIAVAAPLLQTAAVVSDLVQGATRLTADERRYLDLIGNRNGLFDVGDFRAWVDATGAPLSGVAAALSGRRP
jgi:M6 family metalloprotease-like protein